MVPLPLPSSLVYNIRTFRLGANAQLAWSCIITLELVSNAHNIRQDRKTLSFCRRHLAQADWTLEGAIIAKYKRRISGGSQIRWKSDVYVIVETAEDLHMLLIAHIYSCPSVIGFNIY